MHLFEVPIEKLKEHLIVQDGFWETWEEKRKDCNGGAEDLRNLEAGQALGLTFVLDVDGVSHTISVADWDTILNAIRAIGLAILQKYWILKDAVNGYTLHAKTDENDTRLGEIDGWHYIHSTEPQEQDERIEWQEVTLTDTEKELLKLQRPNKNFARMKLEDVGDIQDFIADAMKLIEFNMMLTARLAGDLYGTNPIDAATKEVYKARNKAFLDAVDAGQITLRGDFDNMDVAMARLLERVSKTNQIVRDNYIAEMQRVGLA